MIINSLKKIQMKKFTYAFMACVAMVGLSLTSCSSNDTIEEVSTVTEAESADSTSDQVTVLEVDGLGTAESFTITAGVSSMNVDSLNAAMQPTDSLTVEEVAYLLDLREARKLQQDLMTAAREAFPKDETEDELMPKMHEAHKTHKDAVARMLGFYGIEVPELGEAGVFEDATLQASYDSAVAAMTSETEALQVLMGQKELTILMFTTDLTTVENDNIQMLLENLLRAAQNHLCALNNKLLESEITYVPTVLSQEDFDAIIETGIQRGPAHSGRNMFGKTNGEKGGPMNRMNAGQARGQGSADGESTDDEGGKGSQGKGRPDGQGGKGGRGGHGMGGQAGGDAGDASTDDSGDDSTEE